MTPVGWLWSRLLVTDAGLVGVRTAAFAGLGVTGAAILTAAATALLPGSGPPVAAVVVAGIVAAIGSTMVSGDPVARAGLVGPALGLAAAAGTLAAFLPGGGVALVVELTVATSAAVWARRFAPPWPSLAVMTWLGFVVTETLRAQSPPPVVALATGSVVAGAWLGVLAVTAFRPRPAISASLALHGLLAACDDAIASRRSRWRRRGPDRVRLDLLRTALVADAHLQRAGTPTAQLLRADTVRAHQAADRVCTAERDSLDGAVADLRSAIWALRAGMVRGACADEPVGRPLGDGVRLMRGSLPGALGVAATVSPDGRHTARATVTAVHRQTVQTAVAALVAASVCLPLSAGRTTWAVLAVFTVMTAPGVVAGTVAKALGRITGTTLGVAVGIGLGAALSGVPPIAVLVVAGTLAFWWQPRRFALAIASATVAVSAVYRLLSAPVTELLLLRLADTVVGAACAAGATALIWPLTGRSVRAAAWRQLRARERDLAETADDDRPALAAAVVRVEAAADAVVHSAIRPRRSVTAARCVLDRVAISRGRLDAPSTVRLTRVETSP